MILDSNNLGGRKMNLWIRSQNKCRLLKVDSLQIIHNEEDKQFPYYINASYKLLGTYKTEKRALEVLNDIQNIVNAKTIIKFKEFVPNEYLKRVKDAIDKNSIVELPSYEIKELAGVIVYEMPEE